ALRRPDENRSCFRRGTRERQSCGSRLLIWAAIIGQKSRPVGRYELVREMRAHAVGAETAKIEVEVAMDWNELADIDSGGAFAQPFRRFDAGRVVVAGDIEAAEGRGEIEG